MVDSHSFFQRLPGRRDQERKRFGELMRRVEVRRRKLGLSKKELAAELRTTDDAVRAWMTGQTIGRKETVAKIRAFLRST
jgi:ribosome-binding protein aMBF1 (putative translation factor)